MGSLSSPELSGLDGLSGNCIIHTKKGNLIGICHKNLRGGQDKVESPSKHFPPVMGGEPTKFYPGEGKESGRQSY